MRTAVVVGEAAISNSSSSPCRLGTSECSIAFSATAGCVSSSKYDFRSVALYLVFTLGGLLRFRSAQLVLMMIRQLGPHYEVAWCASSCCSLSSGRLVSMEVELLTLISRWALALSNLERSGLQRSCPVRLPSRAEIIRKSVVVRMTLHNTRVLHVFCFSSTRAVGHQVVARLMRVVIRNDGPCVSECMAPYQWLLG